jgi:hypothetical protein
VIMSPIRPMIAGKGEGHSAQPCIAISRGGSDEVFIGLLARPFSSSPVRR